MSYYRIIDTLEMATKVGTVVITVPLIAIV